RPTTTRAEGRVQASAIASRVKIERTRRLLALLAATLALLATPLRAQSVSPMFRGNARHTGVSANAGAHFGGLLWRAQTGGPVRSTPALVDGTLYAGSTDGHLYAIDAASGAVRW